ncbi:hypothetical protein MMC18_009527 [Xylographa bjoerkii]|nr:hypothetical protein [Xylographa bjoerkii]
MDRANNYFSPPGPTSPTIPSSMSLQQWQQIQDIIHYEISMAISKAAPVAEPLAESPFHATITGITCRRCRLEFPSKAQLLQHVQSRPRCTRIKTLVDITASPRAYPLYAEHSTHIPPANPVLFPTFASSGGGCSQTSFASGPLHYNESEEDYSGDEYQQEVELQLELEGDHMDAPEQYKEGFQHPEPLQEHEAFEPSEPCELPDHDGYIPEPEESMDGTDHDITDHEDTEHDDYEPEGYDKDYNDSYDDGYDDDCDDGSWSD